MFSDKIKSWFKKNQKYVLIGGSVVLSIIGSGVGYVLYKNNKMNKGALCPLN